MFFDSLKSGVHRGDFLTLRDDLVVASEEPVRAISVVGSSTGGVRFVESVLSMIISPCVFTASCLITSDVRFISHTHYASTNVNRLDPA